jgi:hypothetical protein
MRAIVKTKIGKTEYSFEIEEQDEIQTLHKVAVLGNSPDYCDKCRNTENDEGFKLESTKDKEGNTYMNVVCQRCQAKAKLGQYKTKGYFWHNFEVYQRKEEK